MNDESPQEYEAQLAAERQEERLQQLQQEKQRKKEETRSADIKTLKAGIKGLGQGGWAGAAKGVAEQELKNIAKQGTRRIVVLLMRWLGWMIITLWPYILAGIIIILVILFLVACYDNSTACAADITDTVFDSIF